MTKAEKSAGKAVASSYFAKHIVSAILRRAMPMKNWAIKAAVMLLVIAVIIIAFAPSAQ